MDNHEPSLQEYSRLYQAAKKIMDLKPWQWMWDSDIFGIQDPETGALGYYCVTGRNEEHFGVSVFIGSEGYYGLTSIFENPNFNPKEILDLPQIQFFLADRDELKKKDLDILKKLKYRFRGKQAWPVFRSYKAGFLPWFLELSEVRFMTHALEQLNELVSLWKDETERYINDEQGLILHRIAETTPEGITWHNTYRSVEPPVIKGPTYRACPEKIKTVLALPRSATVIELDIIKQYSMPIQDAGDRPYFGYLMLCCDAKTGMVITVNLMKPEDPLTLMWEKVPDLVLDTCIQIGSRPYKIRVCRQPLIGLMQNLSKDVPISIETKPSLKVTGNVFSSLDFFGNGSFY